MRGTPRARASATAATPHRCSVVPSPPSSAAVVTQPYPTIAPARNRKCHPPATRTSARIRERQGAAVQTSYSTAAAPRDFDPTGTSAIPWATWSGGGRSPATKKRKSPAPHARPPDRHRTEGRAKAEEQRGGGEPLLTDYTAGSPASLSLPTPSFISSAADE
jgi:hypothetical protein